MVAIATDPGEVDVVTKDGQCWKEGDAEAKSSVSRSSEESSGEKYASEYKWDGNERNNLQVRFWDVGGKDKLVHQWQQVLLEGVDEYAIHKLDLVFFCVCETENRDMKQAGYQDGDGWYLMAQGERNSVRHRVNVHLVDTKTTNELIVPNPP